MINKEKLAEVIAAYKEYFPEHWKDEVYKWGTINSVLKRWI